MRERGARGAKGRGILAVSHTAETSARTNNLIYMLRVKDKGVEGWGFRGCRVYGSVGDGVDGIDGVGGEW